MGVQTMPPWRSSIRLDPAKSFHHVAPSTCHPHITPALWKLVAARALETSLPASVLFIRKWDGSASAGLNEGTIFLWQHFRFIQSAGPTMETPSPYNSLVLPWSKQKGCWGNIPSEGCFLSWGVNGKEKWFMVILDPHWNNTKWIWKMDDGSFRFSETLLTETMANTFIVQQVWHL